MEENLATNEQTLPSRSALAVFQTEGTLNPSLEPIFALAGASEDNRFVFTSSGAEAINQVLWSVFLKVSRETGKCHFITSALEDAATLQMMKRLEELGCFVKIAPVTAKGEIDVAELKKLIGPRTALISIAMAQGMTGVVQPVEEIAAIAREKNVLLHVDATHAMGKCHLSFDAMNASYLTFAGDRIHSVIGSGGIIAKKEAPLVPLILGGGNKDMHSLQALSIAALEAGASLDAMCLDVARLRNEFEKEIVQTIPGARVLFAEGLRLPNTSVIAFPGVHQEALHSLLLMKKVKTSLGGSYSQHLYPLLTGCGVPEETATSALHFSFSRAMRKDAFSQVLQHLRESVLSLQKIAHQPTPLFVKTPLPLTKLMREKVKRLQFVGNFSPEIAKEKGMRYVVGHDKNVSLHFLVDATDGVIADVKFQAFGPLAFIAAAETLSEMTIRKTYKQAARITADLIDQGLRDRVGTPAFTQEGYSLLNQLIATLDMAIQGCEDIPCATQDYITPLEGLMDGNGLPDWETFSLDKRRALIEEVVKTEIRPYIELDEGNIRILDVKDNHEVVITYEGSCTTCHSATGSTLSAIQQILRARLHKGLSVTPSF